jgi:hypothetical protein
MVIQNTTLSLRTAKQGFGSVEIAVDASSTAVSYICIVVNWDFILLKKKAHSAPPQLCSTGS